MAASSSAWDRGTVGAGVLAGAGEAGVVAAMAVVAATAVVAAMAVVAPMRDVEHMAARDVERMAESHAAE
jgi:hypothetical protein